MPRARIFWKLRSSSFHAWVGTLQRVGSPGTVNRAWGLSPIVVTVGIQAEVVQETKLK